MSKNDHVPEERRLLDNEEQVFYRLYEDYVGEKLAWEKEQADQRNALEALYPGNSQDSNQKRQEAYLAWYETVAEARMQAVDEKLDRVQKMNPDGRYVYPAAAYSPKLTRSDGSGMHSGVLQTAAARSRELAVLVTQRDNILVNLASLMAMIPDDDTVNAYKQAIKEANAASVAAVAKLADEGLTITGDRLSQALEILRVFGMVREPNQEQQAIGVAFLSPLIPGIVPEQVVALLKQGQTLQIVRQAVTDSADQAISAAQQYFEARNMAQLKDAIVALKVQLMDVNVQVDNLYE
jgi:hypothetical protein